MSDLNILIIKIILSVSALCIKVSNYNKDIQSYYPGLSVITVARIFCDKLYNIYSGPRVNHDRRVIVEFTLFGG